MRRIDELKKEIIHEILNSEEYREYRRLQSEIDRTPDLKRQVDEFRMRNFELQNSENVPDMFAAMENLNKEYADMRYIPKTIIKTFSDTDTSILIDLLLIKPDSPLL